jgi:hypothetical protein
MLTACWRDRDGTILMPLSSSQHNLYDIPIAVYTVLDSWWWTENLSETCRDIFQKQVWEIWFCYKNISRCTVLWISKITTEIYTNAVNMELHRKAVCCTRSKHNINSLVFYQCELSGFGGLGVACWPLVPKFAGSNPAETVGFFGQKFVSTPSFGGEVKPSVPCRRFAACKRSLNVAKFLAHAVPPFALRGLSGCMDEETDWRRKWERLKH